VASAVAGPPQVDTGGNNQEQQAPKVSRKVPKLAKKNKSRLPRREKKARQKAGHFSTLRLYPLILSGT
jgi:hypothetical protein